MAAKKKTPPSYSEASEELEQILSEIESGEADVDELSVKVARAAELLQLCRDKLTRTEMQVKKVVEDLAREVDEGEEEDDAAGDEG